MSMLHVALDCQDWTVKACRPTDLSFGVVLDCTDLYFDGLVGSHDAAVGVASPTGLSSYTISFRMCVPALCLTSMLLGSWSLCSITF